MRDNASKIESLQYDVNVAKERLMKVSDALEHVGARQTARSLYTIIEKLEIWQNK